MNCAEEECFRDRSLAIWMELATAEPSVLATYETDVRDDSARCAIGDAPEIVSYGR